MSEETFDTKAEELKMILNIPRDIKLKVLQDALDKDEIGIFITMSKILLDAPISKGGIESEVLTEMHTNHLNKRHEKRS